MKLQQRAIQTMRSRDMKIILEFRESEMEYLKSSIMKYFGCPKPKTKKDLKLWTQRLCGTFVSKGLEAIEDGREYMEVK